jgi:serralysin
MDRQGHLPYVCEGLLPLKNALAQANSATGEGGIAAVPYPASETFSLHSRPGATKVIYLDFDGNTTTGTPWNSNFTGGAAIATPPYSTDADTSSFSAGELDNIQNIWLRVVEDFSPFEVDVTTEYPGLEALRRSSTSDTSFGVRVCIGGSSYDWFEAGAGGVAYLNSFSWNTDSPCFVFTAQLGNGNPKYTAEAVSHDGQTNITEYYTGHANWAPFMGVGYYRDVVQWSKGDYASANNKQDDTAIIAGICSYRQDVHGDSIVDATPLTGTTPLATGVIERRSDADLFGFSTGAGTVSFTARLRRL